MERILLTLIGLALIGIGFITWKALRFLVPLAYRSVHSLVSGLLQIPSDLKRLKWEVKRSRFVVFNGSGWDGMEVQYTVV